MANDFIYNPQVRRLLRLPPLAPEGVGAGGSFGGAGSSYPNRSSGIPLRRTSFTDADLPPETAPAPPDEFNAFSPEALDPLGMNKPRVPSIMDAATETAAAPAPMPTPNPQPAPPPTPPSVAPPTLAAAATPPPAGPAGGSPLDMSGAVGMRGVIPGPTFGIVPPEETRGVEVGRSDAGTPAGGGSSWLARSDGLPGLLKRTSEYAFPSLAPAPTGDSWGTRRYGLPGMLNVVGDYEREALTAGQESMAGARSMLTGAGRAIGNWFAGRPQEAPVQPPSPGAPPAQASTATQTTVRAASGAPKAAPGSIAQANAAAGRPAQPAASPAPPSLMGPPEELAGVPTYTNADLDRVRESGPMRGGYVQGSMESLPLGEQIAHASGERTLAELKTAGTGLTPSMQRALEYKRQESDIRFKAMDALIDQEAERQLAELQADPRYSPQQKKLGIDAIKENALQQKLWSRQLGVAGWPRTGVDTYDPATGEPLYGPSTVQPPG